MVGATGFEPATSWTQTTRSSQAELRSEGAGDSALFQPNGKLIRHRHRWLTAGRSFNRCPNQLEGACGTRRTWQHQAVNAAKIRKIISFDCAIRLGNPIILT